jgi:prephenate dehydrogenase
MGSLWSQAAGIDFAPWATAGASSVLAGLFAWILTKGIPEMISQEREARKEMIIQERESRKEMLDMFRAELSEARKGAREDNLLMRQSIDALTHEIRQSRDGGA